MSETVEIEVDTLETLVTAGYIAYGDRELNDTKKFGDAAWEAERTLKD